MQGCVWDMPSASALLWSELLTIHSQNRPVWNPPSAMLLSVFSVEVISYNYAFLGLGFRWGRVGDNFASKAGEGTVWSFFGHKRARSAPGCPARQGEPGAAVPRSESVRSAPGCPAVTTPGCPADTAFHCFAFHWLATTSFSTRLQVNRGLYSDGEPYDEPGATLLPLFVHWNGLRKYKLARRQRA